MGFFNSGFFWFLEGIFVCLAVMGFRVWMEDRGVAMPVWKWILLGIWVLLLGFTIAFIGTNLGEKEVTAALKGGIIFGLVTIIAGVGLWRLITRKKA
ncbi:MAG: dehalogenase [Candidatus Aminicenantes bacterium]|nr:MAG: dehalogenase [Candidatus Aminicenantes bacterium]